MKKSKWLVLLMALVMVLSLAACGGEEVPTEEPKVVGDCWADQYLELIGSEQARDWVGYEDMAQKLIDIVEESGATYVYVMSPGVDGVPVTADEDTAEQSFLLTVEGSDDPDPWCEDYGWEVQFTEAWEGTPAVARSAWDDSDEGDASAMCWSGFAPIKDENGNVICILGIDYPCTEVIAENPEWNRDGDDWNGFEDEIEGEVPADVQAMMDKVAGIADKYAKQLSHAE